MRRPLVLATITAVGLAAAPALADVQEDEVAQLRAMLRQQAAVMQSMQRRLDAMEARQRAAATAAATVPKAPAAGPAATPAAGGSRVADGGAPAQRGSPEGRPGSEAQPTAPGAGTVNASPRQQATQSGQAPAPAAGNPPLPVLGGNDRVQVTLSGQVNRMVLFYKDGTGRTNAYFADNNVSSTRLRGPRLGQARRRHGCGERHRVRPALQLISGGHAPILQQQRRRHAGTGAVPGSAGRRLACNRPTVLCCWGGVPRSAMALPSSTSPAPTPPSTPTSPIAAARCSFPTAPVCARRSGDPTISQVFDDFDGAAR